MIERHIPEIAVDGKPLGRHIQHDPRSREHPAEQAAKITSIRHLSFGVPLDQGNIGSCTAQALTGALNSQPNYSGAFENGMPRNEDAAVALYKRETADEGQPYPPNDPGGTGLAVSKAGVELGWLSSYTHCFGLQHLLGALMIRPVMVGVNWYDSMDHPSGQGLVTVTKGAQVRGGHEFFANAIDAPRKLVWFYNSWGPSFGLYGRFCMSYQTLQRLLSEQGDATVPVH